MRRVGVLLAQGGHVGVLLQVDVVDARRRGEEVPLDAGVLARHQEVGVDQHRDHASGPVRLDEAHAAHVAGEVVDVRDAVDGAALHASSERRSATRFSTSRQHLIPLVEGLDVDGADAS